MLGPWCKIIILPLKTLPTTPAATSQSTDRVSSRVANPLCESGSQFLLWHPWLLLVLLCTSESSFNLFPSLLSRADCYSYSRSFLFTDGNSISCQFCSPAQSTTTIIRSAEHMAHGEPPKNMVQPKPSLKIRTASAICWNYLIYSIFRDYNLNHIFLGIKHFCLSR